MSLPYYFVNDCLQSYSAHQVLLRYPTSSCALRGHLHDPLLFSANTPGWQAHEPQTGTPQFPLLLLFSLHMGLVLGGWALLQPWYNVDSDGTGLAPETWTIHCRVTKRLCFSWDKLVVFLPSDRAVISFVFPWTSLTTYVNQYYRRCLYAKFYLPII